MLMRVPPSEKLDVEDHYVAWRQSHDAPQHTAGSDGPFSFCSYPFLLNPRAKSKLLHTEARFLMTQARACTRVHLTSPAHILQKPDAYPPCTHFRPSLFIFDLPAAQKVHTLRNCC